MSLLARTAAAPRRLAPSDRVNVAVIGAGGRGVDNIRDVLAAGANLVALCDCDESNAAESFAKHPQARKYRDWRRLLDASKDLDAVLVSTPDHNHAVISIAAMQLGKHVYCEKPLARSIWEAREMARVATASRVATQMGTQGHAFEGTRRAVEVLRAGIIGDVTELHVWTDRPAGWWPQGVPRPTDTPPVPATLDWDVWLGPALARPYNPAYVPFKWRGFWDFGTGAIGDMGIHNLDTAYWALELGTPTRVAVRECSPAMTDPTTKETAPLWSIIELEFPARGEPPRGEDGLVRRREASAQGAVPRREADYQRRRVAHHRQQGHALHADVARRRDREGHVRPAAARKVCRPHAPSAVAAANPQPPPGVDRRLPWSGQDRSRPSSTPPC